MIPPSLLVKLNVVHRHDLERLLEHNTHLLKWKADGTESFFDVGCGAGDITTEVLLPFLPTKFRRLVGVDVSEEMIAYAKSHCDRKGVEYLVADFMGEVRGDFEGAFDGAFSFYCMHHLSDYGKALQNMNKLLKPGGSLFLTMMVDFPHLTLHGIMKETEKWHARLADCPTFTPAYHNNNNAAKDFTRLLEEANFNVKVCEVQMRSHEYGDLEQLKEFIAVLNPVPKFLPDKMRDDYWKDYYETWKSITTFPLKYGDDGKMFFCFKMLLAIAVKEV